MTIAPIKRTAHTKAPPHKAFEIFTGQAFCQLADDPQAATRLDPSES